VSLVGGKKGVAEFKKLADGLWGEESSEQGTRNVGEGRVAWGMTASEFLATHGVAPDLTIALTEGTPAQETDWIHYRIGKNDIYFLAELEGKARDVIASFRVAGRVPELWNPVDGSIREATRFTFADGRTRLPITLGAYDSHFVVFRKATTENSRDSAPNASVWTEVQQIPAPWQVTFNPKFGGPEEPVAFAELIDWLDHPDAAIRDYSGKAIYRTKLELSEEQARQPLALELGVLRGVSIARVKLNGKDLGVTWRPPYRLALGEAAKAGANTLEITVINSWRNRVTADEKLPEAERFTRTNVGVQHQGRFKWHPEPSGLIGPVRLVMPGE
jgi:hypothetical protein